MTQPSQQVDTVTWRVPVSMLSLMEQLGALLFVEDPDNGAWIPDVHKAAAMMDILAEGDAELSKSLHQQLQDSYLDYLRMAPSPEHDNFRFIP